MFPLFKEKPVKIRFSFDPALVGKRFTVYDTITLERMQTGERSTERLITLMAHFMVDEAGQPLAEDKALKVLEKLSGDDFRSVAEQFGAALQEGTVPNATGSGSNSPSDRGQANPLPAGSTS